MTSTTTKPDSLQPAAEMAVDLFDNWFDPIETEVRARAREFIEEMIRGELDTVLARPRLLEGDVSWVNRNLPLRDRAGRRDCSASARTVTAPGSSRIKKASAVACSSTAPKH